MGCTGVHHRRTGNDRRVRSCGTTGEPPLSLRVEWLGCLSQCSQRLCCADVLYDRTPCAPRCCVCCRQPWIPVTGKVQVWLSSIVILCVFGVANILFENVFVVAIYACIFAMCFCCFIIYDIQSVVGAYGWSTARAGVAVDVPVWDAAPGSMHAESCRGLPCQVCAESR